MYNRYVATQSPTAANVIQKVKETEVETPDSQIPYMYRSEKFE